MAPNCHICNRESKSWGSLIKHSAQTHKINAEEYFLKYVGTKSCCIHCGGEGVRFLSASEGYSANCKDCESIQRKQSATKMRENLKNDPAKHKQFIEKLSASVTETYPQRRTLRKFIDGNELLNSPKHEPHWRKLALTMKMDIDYSKPTSSQIDKVVEQNLTKTFGF